MAEKLQDRGSRADDEAAVRDLYRQLLEGWNRGSAEGFAAPFADGGHLVAFDGVRFQGRDEIVAFHQPLFDKWLKGTRLVGEVKDVRFLAPGVALMHAAGSTVMRGKSRPARERYSVQTLVAVRQEAGWRLAAFHNTRIRPMSSDGRSAFLWLATDWLWRVFGPR